MSTFGFCVNGGMDGIKVTTEELSKFAQTLQSKFVDEFIPLPNVQTEVQLTRIKDCTFHEHDDSYWERENGKHGWCCSYCGAVVQWG